MEPLLPATEALFLSQRQQQQHFVRTAEIQKTLRQTTQHALTVLEKLAQRGEELDTQGLQADAVEASSLAMARQIQRENELRTWWGWIKGLFCCGSGAPSPRVVITTTSPAKTKEGRRPLYFATAAATDK